MKTLFRFKTFLLLFLFVIIYYSNNIQAQNKSESKPDVHINVNREFDEKGNVIKYDSTYSWSWSSDGSQSINDSIAAKFPQILNNKSFFDNSFNNQFNFFNDTTFFGNDPMFGNFEKQMQEMLQRQQQMFDEIYKQIPDSLNNKKNNKSDRERIEPQQNKSQNKGIDL